MNKGLAIILACAATAPCAAAPAKKRVPAKKAAPLKKAVPAQAKKPAARLLGIEVLPPSVKLRGVRAEQGLIVTGRYSDGAVKDLTQAAVFKVSNPKVASVVKDQTRRVVRPVGDGAVTVAVTVGAARANFSVAVSEALRREPISFTHDVVPALTKAGCSMGTCHGTPTGKGGLRLSLQGYAPDADFQSLAREGGARRVNKADPGRSLLLLKPMAEVPHAGGKRLSRDMPEFDVISRWIGEGMKPDPETAPRLTRVEILPGNRVLALPGAKQQIVAMAHYSDGSVRDVTTLAKLSTSDEEVATISREGLVEGYKRGEVAVLVRYEEALETQRVTFLKEVPGFRWNNPAPSNFIDKLVFERLRMFQIPASGLSSDQEFLRRAYLDAIGLLPTAEEARAFLGDPAPDKRTKLIERLTERPEFADFWAVKWADVLRVQDETMKDQGARAFHDWIRDSIKANKPMDQFVKEIVTATGPTFSVAPANYYRTFEQPNDFSESVAQLFLGVRMTCAKCHNHPFERWTQDEYYQFAAFFSQVRKKGGPTKEEETIYLRPKGEVEHLRTGLVMKPKLLAGEFPSFQPNEDRRQALAEWMTRQDNPFFGKAIANRVWSHLLGRGIVEPIDDFRASNPPVNEPLLEALGKDFAQHGFDLKYLVRTIMNSRTYQLTARPEPLNKDDQTYFSHALPRMLTAEQLSDAIAQVTGVPEEFPGYPKGTRAMQIAGTKARTPFLKTFGRPDRNLNCECEREKEPNLFQALALISGRSLDGRLRDDSSRTATLAASGKPDPALIEDFYLASLARMPSAKERQNWLSHFARTADKREALEDLAWVLINSKEFQFRH